MGVAEMTDYILAGIGLFMIVSERETTTMTTETTNCDDGQCQHTIAECPAFQAAESTTEATAVGNNGEWWQSTHDKRVIIGSDHQPILRALVPDYRDAPKAHAVVAQVVNEHNSVQRLKEALRSSAMDLHTLQGSHHPDVRFADCPHFACEAARLK